MADTAVMHPGDVARVLIEFRRRWMATALFVGAVAVAYAVLKPPTWEASQALIVRDEAIGAPHRPGKFTHVDEMKTTLETILELAKSRGVLEPALREVGPPADYQTPSTWPTAKDVESLQGALALSPPKGAEFGKTEVFYLKVQAGTSQRAVDLAAAIVQQLQVRSQEVRLAKASSVTQDLTTTVAMAQKELDAATKVLTEKEAQVGGDLAELRMLNEAPNGDSDLRRIGIELENELRREQAALDGKRGLLELLQSAQVDSGRLLASPNMLLESQPALRRLKDGLVDAQLRTAQVMATMSKDHPLTLAAIEAERAVGQHLYDELAIAVRGLQLEVKLAADRVANLQRDRDRIQQRFNKLAAARADYANLAATARHRGEILKAAQQELSEAQAAQATAQTASLITPIDSPNTGSRPIGLGRSAIAMAGLLGGLVAGFGVVFLTAELNDRRARPVRRPKVTRPVTINHVPVLSFSEAYEKSTSP